MLLGTSCRRYFPQCSTVWRSPGASEAETAAGLSAGHRQMSQPAWHCACLGWLWLPALPGCKGPEPTVPVWWPWQNIYDVDLSSSHAARTPVLIRSSVHLLSHQCKSQAQLDPTLPCAGLYPETDASAGKWMAKCSLASTIASPFSLLGFWTIQRISNGFQSN